MMKVRGEGSEASGKRNVGPGSLRSWLVGKLAGVGGACAIADTAAKRSAIAGRGSLSITILRLPFAGRVTDRHGKHDAAAGEKSQLIVGVGISRGGTVVRC